MSINSLCTAAYITYSADYTVSFHSKATQNRVLSHFQSTNRKYSFLLQTMKHEIIWNVIINPIISNKIITLLLAKAN